jgi:hypothetical protein
MGEKDRKNRSRQRSWEEEVPMDASDVFLCGLVWARFRSPDALEELLNALDSPDPESQALAEAMLTQADLCDAELIEGILAATKIHPLEPHLTQLRWDDYTQDRRPTQVWWLPIATA